MGRFAVGRTSVLGLWLAPHVCVFGEADPSGIHHTCFALCHPLIHPSLQTQTMRWQWLGRLRFISFFQYGFDSLVSNEMAGRQLTDLPVESGSAVLAQLGFEPGEHRTQHICRCRIVAPCNLAHFLI